MPNTTAVRTAQVGAAPFFAGKNKIINGDFEIWQRGTSFSTGNTYAADRWVVNSNATFTVSRQTFTPGAAPVAGYEGEYFLRFDKSAGGSFGILAQRIEDVRTFAGQTVTISFWAKVASGTVTIEPYVAQTFGSGGSADAGAATSTVTATTSWQRFSIQYAVPSVSGKTIGASSYIEFSIGRVITASAYVLDIWGVQVEAGSTATAFQTATGTIQGELAACQRYYWRNTPSETYGIFGFGYSYTTTGVNPVIPFPVPMRITPTSLDASGTTTFYMSSGDAGVKTTYSTVTIDSGATNRYFGVPSFAVTGATSNAQYRVMNNNNAGAFLGWSAEL